MGSSAQAITVGNRKLEVSNLDKVFYPATGFTKGDVIDYYRAVSDVLLPHLKQRAVTLKRYPNGVTGPFFYEKACPKHRPSWIKTVALHRQRDSKDVNYCQLNTEAALVWAANLANLELHVSLASARALHKPQSAVFDLDPGEGTGVLECAGVAIRLREIFAERDLDCVVKTSGSKGLQLYVPLNTPASFDDTNRWAKAVAQQLEAETPDEVVSVVSKEARKGRVFIDWSQNNVARTTVCVYSLRAIERSSRRSRKEKERSSRRSRKEIGGPTASTPLTWDEVTAAHEKSDPGLLTFTYDQVLSRVERHGDLFEPVRSLKQRLPKFD